MAQSVHFAMQTYRRNSKGRLAQAKWTPCETAIEAVTKAEAVVAAGRVSGAAAISHRCSGEFDEGETPITIAAFGEVPKETLDQVPF